MTLADWLALAAICAGLGALWTWAEHRARRITPDTRKENEQ